MFCKAARRISHCLSVIGWSSCLLHSITSSNMGILPCCCFSLSADWERVDTWVMTKQKKYKRSLNEFVIWQTISESIWESVLMRSAWMCANYGGIEEFLVSHPTLRRWFHPPAGSVSWLYNTVTYRPKGIKPPTLPSLETTQPPEPQLPQIVLTDYQWYDMINFIHRSYMQAYTITHHVEISLNYVLFQYCLAKLKGVS